MDKAISINEIKNLLNRHGFDIIPIRQTEGNVKPSGNDGEEITPEYAIAYLVEFAQRWADENYEDMDFEIYGDVIRRVLKG